MKLARTVASVTAVPRQLSAASCGPLTVHVSSNDSIVRHRESSPNQVNAFSRAQSAHEQHLEVELLFFSCT